MKGIVSFILFVVVSCHLSFSGTRDYKDDNKQKKERTVQNNPYELSIRKTNEAANPEVSGIFI